MPMLPAIRALVSLASAAIAALAAIALAPGGFVGLSLEYWAVPAYAAPTRRPPTPCSCG
jgi:hypothetical protein